MTEGSGPEVAEGVEGVVAAAVGAGGIVALVEGVSVGKVGCEEIGRGLEMT